jgi:hypothetical protein
VALDAGKPVGFGVLTLDDEQQGIDRAGLPGSKEDKGAEAADAALRTGAAPARPARLSRRLRRRRGDDARTATFRYSEGMEILRHAVVLVHLVGFAVLFGAWVVEAVRAPDPRLMTWGMVIAAVAGLALAAPWRSTTR